MCLGRWGQGRAHPRDHFASPPPPPPFFGTFSQNRAVGRLSATNVCPHRQGGRTDPGIPDVSVDMLPLLLVPGAFPALAVRATGAAS
eukprot:SAG11_NODE_4472_length_1883_cov_2.336323_2_plen_87_part_00